MNVLLLVNNTSDFYSCIKLRLNIHRERPSLRCPHATFMRRFPESLSCLYQVRMFTSVVCCSFTFTVLQGRCCSVVHCIYDLSSVTISSSALGIYKVSINESINALLFYACGAIKNAVCCVCVSIKDA